MQNDKTINPYQAYSLEETANLMGIHPTTLRKMVSNREEDELIQKINPQKVGREWRFLGEGLLRALGSATYGQGQSENTINSNEAAGAALVK